MKKLFIICVCFALITIFPCSAFAKNFDSVPTSIDQIEPGDTYGKGDAHAKVFDKDGNLIYDGIIKIDTSDINILSSQWDNGNFGGVTDIWWHYGNPLLNNSGPKAEGSTYSYAIGGSDYLSAKVQIYVADNLKVTKEGHKHYATSLTVSAQHLVYPWPGRSSRANTEHKVIDSNHGWNRTFNTVDTVF